MTLTRGTNAPLSTPGLTAGAAVVDVEWEADGSSGAARLAVLACDDRVRSVSADHVVVHEEPSTRGGRRWFSTRLDLSAVPDDTHVLAVVLVDTTPWGPRRGLRVSVSCPSAPEPITFPVEGLVAELGVALVELYRRQGVWKVRAVGQGIVGGAADVPQAYGAHIG